MRLNSKGQVTIPAELRRKYALEEGDEVEVIEVGNALQIVRREGAERRGKRLTRHMRGRATTTMTTDELMALFRGE
ncbi:AbrB/MazE/SpoVT family DNA-binding domain-containing protein [Nocardia sp. NBC_00508]|uniref:AbrB/MazE/SpoVT family DNA-binding domain-containing protein n=1 Tax=Nocardia sp. NBC_00508 TaxID=2975992 RepID=UPI002E813AAA|nr:AbrB/MazE/SpoVT family DNA-binding domain-containing protein [Nocardia sp. NBC_00508]WUD65097.1 AbrB/MazE/SpoVT family DNA-binding domain-containing protein [Nocardia sp. NBC_00508]